MTSPSSTESWNQFIEYIKGKCSKAAFGNWFAPVKVIEERPEELILEIPNIFVKEYILTNFKKDLLAFMPVKANNEPAVTFRIGKSALLARSAPKAEAAPKRVCSDLQSIKLNPKYVFDTFVEGPTNQFVKSAAMGVASHPGKSYNPFFIHGSVGNGKTHILHSIGHEIQKKNKNLKVQCITTEGFINDLVNSLRNKYVDRMKRFYRSDVDVLLVDDIQFLQNRPNFEEELCHTFETLINQGKQIVITSDKPPAQLKLSERMIARLEWGLVAHIGLPELETRVAILLKKAEQKGIEIPSQVAFFIAEHIYNNIRQLEGAVNRLAAHCKLMNLGITEHLVETALKEMLQHSPRHKITIDQILKSVAAVFQVRVNDLRGNGRAKQIALPRQVAMYLAYKMINESLQGIGASFGKTHSTILHACKNIEKKVACDETLKRQISMIERNIAA